jgi:hypothetical protein
MEGFETHYPPFPFPFLRKHLQFSSLPLGHLPVHLALFLSPFTDVVRLLP